MKWHPPSKKQLKLLAWWGDKSPVNDRTAIIADGAVRVGKTIFLGLSYILWAMTNYQEQNFGISGKTIGVCERNVITPLVPILEEELGYAVKHKRQQSILEVTSSETTNYFYIFGGKDESSQDLVQGITLAGFLFDEVALMPRSFVEQALARCSVHGAKYWFNCNPEHPNHWFYKEWIKKQVSKNVYYLHFLMTDNPSLSPETIARYEQQFSGVFYERAVLGRWVVAQGAIYPMFTKAKNTFTTMPHINNPRYFVSVDHGTYNPFSAGLWAHSFQDDVSYRLREYYYNGREEQTTGRGRKTDEEYADAIEELTKGIARSRITVIVDPSASPFIEVLERRRFTVNKANNEVLAGISRVSTRLANGQLLIHENCKASIAEFGQYRWDDSKEQDTPIEENDHAMDEIRYFVNEITQSGLSW